MYRPGSKAEERVQRTLQHAQESYKTHVITKRSEGRFLLQKPYPDGKGFSSDYATEVIALHNGRLFVGGDIDDVVFAYGPREPLSCIEWIGLHPAFDHYLMEKAAIGRGARAEVWQFDYDLAVTDLAVHFERPEDDIVELIHVDDQEDKREFERAFYACSLHDPDGDDWEWLQSVGEVPAVRIPIAYRAVQRLCALLSEEAPNAG